VTVCVGSDQASGKVRQQASVQLAAAASDLTALIAVGGSGLAPDSTGTHLCNLLLPAASWFLFVWLMHRLLAGWPAHTPQQHLVINRQKHKGSWHAGQLVRPTSLCSPVAWCKSC